MKKGILLLFVVLMGFTSCGKKFGHRYLDGMWQMQRIEYKDGIIFRERVLDKVLNLYKPEIYKLSDYSKLWIDEKFYPYGNEFMIVK